MTKVALIAVTKDEDTYIHEWIHHHLYLGFSPIYIGVNRTTDKSWEIINKIKKTEKDVHVFCLDWIDKSCIGLNTRIQNLGYSYMSTKIDKSRVDYVGFFDIDEFWFNVEGKKIQTFIEENEPFDIASFFWLCQYGEDTEFSPPFKDVYYKLDDHVKSIVSTDTLPKVDIFTYHVPSYNKDTYTKLVHIDQDGNDISCLNPNKKYNRQQNIVMNKHISTCILHRMIRSEDEYLSLILRGRPNGELIKANGRTGFEKGDNKLPSVFNDTYYTSLNNFIIDNNLTKILAERRVEKLLYYKIKISNMNEKQLIAEMNNAKIALMNTKGLKFFVNAFVKNVKCVNSLRDFALSLEEIDYKLSRKLKQKAHEL